MKKFTDTRLWDILRNPAFDRTGKPDFAAVLDEFVDELHVYCRNETCIAERTRSLNYARNKLRAHFEYYKNEAKKNALLLNAVKLAILFVNDEIGIVKMDLEHPERFLEFPEDNPPLARWDGKIIELIEYYLPLQISGNLLLPSGKPMSYAALIRFLERSYGITIADERNRKAEVVNRSKATVQ